MQGCSGKMAISLAPAAARLHISGADMGHFGDSAEDLVAARRPHCGARSLEKVGESSDRAMEPRSRDLSDSICSSWVAVSNLLVTMVPCNCVDFPRL